MSKLIVLIGCGLIWVPGCMLPAYQRPSGFSSTYFRNLYSQNSSVLNREISPFPAMLQMKEAEEGLPPSPTGSSMPPSSTIPPIPPEPTSEGNTKLEGEEAEKVQDDEKLKVDEQEERRLRKSLSNTAMSLPFTDRETSIRKREFHAPL